MMLTRIATLSAVNISWPLMVRSRSRMSTSTISTLGWRMNHQRNGTGTL